MVDTEKDAPILAEWRVANPFFRTSRFDMHVAAARDVHAPCGLPEQPVSQCHVRDLVPVAASLVR